MSFNKAESVAATSGYWRWVGDVEEMRKQRKSYRPKFRMNGTEAAIASLDPEMARRHGDEWDKERAQLQGEVSLDTYLGRC